MARYMTQASCDYFKYAIQAGAQEISEAVRLKRCLNVHVLAEKLHQRKRYATNHGCHIPAALLDEARAAARSCGVALAGVSPKPHPRGPRRTHRRR